MIEKSTHRLIHKEISVSVGNLLLLAPLTSKTIEVINIILRSHNHFEAHYILVTSRAESSVAKESVERKKQEQLVNECKQLFEKADSIVERYHF